MDLLSGDVAHMPMCPGEPDRTLADIARIRRLLGWEPGQSIEEGLRMMLQNIEYWCEAPVWTPEKIAFATREWFRYLGDSEDVNEEG